MAVSDFSVGKLDLPQISEDLPEDFFARVSSAANGADDVTKCSGGQFEDGKFGIEGSFRDFCFCFPFLLFVAFIYYY